MKIETKFDIGEEVWFFWGGSIICASILKIYINGYITKTDCSVEITYVTEQSQESYDEWNESEIFGSKEELLEHLSKQTGYEWKNR